MKINIDPLFSTPVLISLDRYMLSKEETQTAISFEMQSNADGRDNSFANTISKNKSVLNDLKFKNLKKWLQKGVDSYVRDVMKYNQGDYYITQSWITFTDKNQKHHRHNHWNSVLSGVFYFTDSDAKINFYSVYEPFIINPTVSEHNMFNSLTWSYPAEKGKLILFPSTIKHDVSTQQEEGTRISLAFNVWVKGKIGIYTEANELEL